MNKNKTYKPIIIGAVSVLTALALTAAAFAWFTNQRRLDTITRINSPVSLSIGAGARESSANIDMGGIDVSDEAGKKNFVFSVYSDEAVGDYKIQLAHTTNIEFKYALYKAEESLSAPSSGESVLYVDETDTARYYIKDSVEIAGTYLNADGIIADKSLHEKSYDSYGNVQKNAEPLYWQNTESIKHGSDSSGFVDYYILEVSWDVGTVTNDKETDIVYLTAGMV
ncbi:MAG: hypothetical protein ACI4J1_09060 [Ruminiclostridium sp.]